MCIRDSCQAALIIKRLRDLIAVLKSIDCVIKTTLSLQYTAKTVHYHREAALIIKRLRDFIAALKSIDRVIKTTLSLQYTAKTVQYHCNMPIIAQELAY